MTTGCLWRPGAAGARHAGSIVSVSSAGGLRGGAAGCMTSKHALIGYTRNVAWT